MKIFNCSDDKHPTATKYENATKMNSRMGEDKLLYLLSLQFSLQLAIFFFFILLFLSDTADFFVLIYFFFYCRKNKTLKYKWKQKINLRQNVSLITTVVI